jgi:TRAP-type C4-dicarboxylate transport system substrate-binding protein
METINTNKYEQLPIFIKAVIDKEIQFATEEELEKAKKRIDERKSQIITGVVLSVQKMMQLETMGDKLIITVKVV